MPAPTVRGDDHDRDQHGRDRGRLSRRSAREPRRWPSSDGPLLLADRRPVVLVDRRHRAGGHWLDAYPFVRLHQPSAYYGVASRRLGDDRIDESGTDKGFYERASAAEICDYYGRLEQDLVGSGRVRFLAMSEYRGEDTEGHRVESLLTGAVTTIRAHTLVDATYVQSEIRPGGGRPTRSTPGCASSRRTTSSRWARRRTASRSSVRARPRWTRVSGCSRQVSTRSGSAGSGRATPGCSTAPSCSPWTWSDRSCRCRRGGCGRLPTRSTGTTSRTGWTRPACSCGSTRPPSRAAGAERRSAWARSTP